MKIDDKIVQISYFILRRIISPIVRLIWIREIKGLENIPKKGPVILAFNHQSYFDFISFIAVSPRNVHYLSAEKFYSGKQCSRLWKPLMRVSGQIKVDRENRDKRIVHDTVFEHLNSGKMIGIFPEGTRARLNDEMLHAFTGVAKYAIKGNVPVIPVGINGTYEVMSRFDKWPKFKKNISINIGTAISFENYKNVKMNKKGYRLLTDKIMLKIAELSNNKYSHLGKMKRTKPTNPKDLVIFDMDGTLIDGQSQQYFLKYMLDKKYINKIQYFKIFFWFVLYKIGIVNNPKKISTIAFSFMKGIKTEQMNFLVEDFFSSILKDKIYSAGKEKVDWHLKMNNDLLLLTNAIEPIAKIVTKYLNIPEYLCTELEIIDNIYTGKILGVNTYGRNKVLKILSYVKENDCNIKKTWAYCDHGSDIDIMGIVKHPIAVNPDKTLKKESKRRGWKIINFKTNEHI